jgi:hypothetical protein
MSLVATWKLRFEQGVVRWGRLQPSWLWMFLLELGEDRFLRIDTPGQHVSPRV